MTAKMEQQEWLDMDSELVLAYIRKLKVEFKDEPSIATVVNGAMIRAEHLGIFGQRPQTPKPVGPAANTNEWGSKAIMCPDCQSTIEPQVSKGTGKVYYKCKTCSEQKGDGGATFINRDGKTYHVVGDKRA